MRRIVHADALTWLAENPAEEGMSVVTSLPDVSELALDLDAWRAWFQYAVRRILRWIPESSVAIFYQSDIRHRGEWIDKGYLVLRAADDERASIVWHKIVCRKPPGSIALGRPSYSHMICVSRAARPTIRRPGPDVLADAGASSWSKGMGEAACRVACRFLVEEIGARTLVDPFCGRGAVLAVAETFGLATIGVDISAKRCRAARSAKLESLKR